MNKVLVVHKRTRWELYHNSPDAETRDYLTSDRKYEQELLRSHDEHHRTLDRVVADLKSMGIDTSPVYRSDVDNDTINGAQLVIPVGGDGTFIDAAHHVRGVPVLGVNSDPAELHPKGSVGYFMWADARNFRDIMEHIESRPVTTIYRQQVRIDGSPIRELVINDLLIADENAASVTRLNVETPQRSFSMPRSNSGMLVCTAAGSTAFMRNEGGPVLPLDSQQLLYHVRSNFEERDRFHATDSMRIESRTRAGKVYVDGDYLFYDMKLGTTIEVETGHPLRVIGDLESKRAA
ncbi:MAG: NAD(+)/NADH kinase [Nanoarchaeota archaeon]